MRVTGIEVFFRRYFYFNFERVTTAEGAVEHAGVEVGQVQAGTPPLGGAEWWFVLGVLASQAAAGMEIDLGGGGLRGDATPVHYFIAYPGPAVLHPDPFQ